MAAPPLLSVARYGAFFTGYTYGYARWIYLGQKDKKYQADQAEAKKHADPAAHHH